MASIVSNQTLPACADIIDVSAFNHYITLLALASFCVVMFGLLAIPKLSCAALSPYGKWFTDLLIAAGIIFILALLQKRRFRPEVCGGRPALIVPLPLLDGYDNRVSYAAAFGAVINIISTLFMDLDSTTYINVAWWARALVLQFRVLGVCITCFPLFACISTRHKLAGAVLGVTYSSILLGSTFAEAVQLYCKVPPYSATDPALTVFRAVSVLIYIPVVLCFFYLIFKFLLTITECIRSSTYVITEPLKRVYTHQQQYVRLVLHRDYDPSKETSTCDKLIYRSIPRFKYPVRIISVVFILLLLLYRIGLALILGGALIFRARATFPDRLPFLGTKFILSPQVAVDLFAAVYFITAIVCVIVTSFNIYLFMKSYRRHLLRMFRGNKSFILDQLPKPHIMMANSMRFPGYQVAYMLWGFSMLFLGLFVAGSIFTFGIYGLIITHYLTYVLQWLLQALSFPATALLLFYLQVVLAKRVLMQEKIKVTDDTPPLNVDNRRFYDCFNYYTLFGNLAIGMFSCFWRILQGYILGIFMVGRLDRSIYARGWEHRDKGYLSYISMLHVENAHNHPMLRVFCDLLLTALDKHGHQQIFQTPVRRNTKALRRWLVAYTLINNPGLAQKRKSQFTRIPEAELECAVDWPIDGGISSSVEFASSGRNVLVYQASPQDHSDL